MKKENPFLKNSISELKELISGAKFILNTTSEQDKQEDVKSIKQDFKLMQEALIIKGGK